MRPTVWPDEEVWDGAERVVMSAPNGDLTHEVISAVECVKWTSEVLSCHAYTLKLVLEPGDLEKLQAGDPVLLTFFGSMPPWDAQVGFSEQQQGDAAEGGVVSGD